MESKGKFRRFLKFSPKVVIERSRFSPSISLIGQMTAAAAAASTEFPLLQKAKCATKGKEREMSEGRQKNEGSSLTLNLTTLPFESKDGVFR